MSWQIRESGSSLEEEHITSFERAHNLTLPNMYRDFLLAYNGGFVEPNHFRMVGPVSEPDQMQNEGIAKIDWFLTMGDSELGSLAQYIQSHRTIARIPPELLPIGLDGEGSLLCMGIEHGDIYFWDYALEYPPGMAPGLQNVYFIAPNLLNFLDGLFAG